MATLTVRDLEDSLKARLRVRAAENGRSMEAEVRAILAAALAGQGPGRGLGSRIRHRFVDLPESEFTPPARHEPARAAAPPES